MASTSVRSTGEQLQQSLEPVLTGDEKNRVVVRIGSAMFAGGLFAVGKLFEYFFPEQEGVYGLILLLGALIVSIPILKVGIQGFLSKGAQNVLEQLVSLALLAAFAKGDYATAILVPLLMSVAHFLEERSILGAQAAIEGLRTLQAQDACLMTDDGEQTVPSEELKPGDTIRLRPGDMFPVDGTVVKGTSCVDQSSMTGETVPIDVAVGAKVFAGTVNMQGLIDVVVEKEVERTSLSKIVDLLRKAEASKTPTMRFIERYTIYYLPLVVLIATISLFMTQDLSIVIAILVVSCPCAQILVSSTAMIASLAVSSNNGILIKNSTFLESLGDIRTVVFDKTGTLTQGNLGVANIVSYGDIDQNEVIKTAAIAARGSRHPVSQAVLRAIDACESVEEVEQAEIQELAGLGVLAMTNGDKIFLGKKEWLEQQGIDTPDLDHSGPSVWLAKNQQLFGCFLLNDSLRPDAQEMIVQMRRQGVGRIVLLTGDRQGVAQSIKEQLELDAVFAECLPTDKLNVVEAEKKEVPIMVVGDGVNDALALSKADVGVAMGAMGSDIAVQSSDIALMGNDLRKIPFLIRLSRKTRRIIYQNMAIAGLSSLTMISLAAMGYIPPLLGAFLHNIGALLVLSNSARLLRFEGIRLQQGHVADPADSCGNCGSMPQPEWKFCNSCGDQR